MHALVTGGSGFIGSHLVRELLRRSHKVTVIDDLSTGSSNNIESLLDNPDLSFVEGDVREADTLAPLVEQTDFSYHLAAAVGVKRIMDEPLASLEILIRGTSTLIELASQKKKPLFLASTSEVYGKADAHVFTEKTPSVIGPVHNRRWLYACAKMLTEFWALAHYRENGLPVIVARFFNVSGPRQTGGWGMVIPTFVRQAMNNEPVTVYGDGTQRRCFMHVNDCIEAVMRLTDNQGAIGQIVNIGSPHEYSMNQLAERVLQLVPGTTSQIQHISYKDAYGPGFEDMLQRRPDTTLLGELTGFQPQQDLDDIIKDIYEYLKSNS